MAAGIAIWFVETFFRQERLNWSWTQGPDSPLQPASCPPTGASSSWEPCMPLVWSATKSWLLSFTFFFRRVCIYHDCALCPGRSLHGWDKVSRVWSILHGWVDEEFRLSIFNTQPFRLAAVLVLFLVGLHQSGGSAKFFVPFLTFFFEQIRWGLRITPGLTLLSALLVLFFMYDPPRCAFYSYLFCVASRLKQINPNSNMNPNSNVKGWKWRERGGSTGANFMDARPQIYFLRQKFCPQRRG